VLSGEQEPAVGGAGKLAVASVLPYPVVGVGAVHPEIARPMVLVCASRVRGGCAGEELIDLSESPADVGCRRGAVCVAGHTGAADPTAREREVPEPISMLSSHSGTDM